MTKQLSQDVQLKRSCARHLRVRFGFAQNSVRIRVSRLLTTRQLLLLRRLRQ